MRLFGFRNVIQLHFWKGATRIGHYDRKFVKLLWIFDALQMRHSNDRNVAKLWSTMMQRQNVNNMTKELLEYSQKEPCKCANTTESSLN